MLVTFDLDGVLQVNPFGKGVFPDVTRKIAPYALAGTGTPPEPQVLQATAERVLQMILENARQRIHAGRLVEAYDWDSVVAEVAQAIGCPLSFVLPEIIRTYCQPGYIRLYDHAHTALQYLASQGADLMIVTNGFDAYQYPVIEALGIAHYFRERFTPERVGTAKPMPQIFETAWEAHLRRHKPSASHPQGLGPGARPAMHIGDTLVHDIYGAHRAGFTGVWVQERLPDSLAASRPWDRPQQEATKQLIETALATMYDRGAYGELDDSLLRPRYIISDLSEIPSVFDHFRNQNLPLHSKKSVI